MIELKSVIVSPLQGPIAARNGGAQNWQQLNSNRYEDEIGIQYCKPVAVVRRDESESLAEHDSTGESMVYTIFRRRAKRMRV